MRTIAGALTGTALLAAAIVTGGLDRTPAQAAPVPAPAFDPPAFDPVVAKAAFMPCSVCHAVTKGANKSGPSLYGIVGRKVATAPGFKYSPSMIAKGGVWSEGALDTYLTNPRQTVPGTYMSYSGQKDPAKRAALIGYLKTLK